jgi:hypothetical protein
VQIGVNRTPYFFSVFEIVMASYVVLTINQELPSLSTQVTKCATNRESWILGRKTWIITDIPNFSIKSSEIFDRETWNIGEKLLISVDIPSLSISELINLDYHRYFRSRNLEYRSKKLGISAINL